MSSLSEDHRRTIDQVCEMSGISWSSIQRILAEDLHMGRVAAKFVPHRRTKGANAPAHTAHTALSVTQFLTKNGMTPIPPPPLLTGPGPL